MAERFNKNTNMNNPKDTLRDLRQAGAINEQAQARLEGVLAGPIKHPMRDSIEPLDMNIYAQIGTSRLRNLRRVVTSAPGNNVNIDDLARLEEIIRITQQAEAQVPKPTQPKPVMPSRRRMLEAVGWGLLGSTILGTGVYDYIERQRTATINEVEKKGKEIMGRDFFGADAIDKTFGIHLPAERVPEIPFSEVELKRARELDQFLILRTDTGPNNIPLTAGAMNWIFDGYKGNKFEREGKIIFSDDGYRNLIDTPRSGWALVQKNILHGSRDRSYLQQVEMLVNYLINGVFKSANIPIVYGEAITEFEKRKSSIQSVIDKHGPLDVDFFTSLKIIELTLHRPSEKRYDLLVLSKAGHLNLLQNGDSLDALKPEETPEGRYYREDLSGIVTHYSSNGSYYGNSSDRGVRLSRIQ